MKIYSGEIPIRREGSDVYSWVSVGTALEKEPIRRDICDWIRNYIFEDTMKIMQYRKGSSIVRFYLRSLKDDKVYSMMLSDLEYMLLHTSVDRGIVTGTWTYRKQGYAYGIRYLGDNTGRDR